MLMLKLKTDITLFHLQILTGHLNRNLSGVTSRRSLNDLAQHSSPGFLRRSVSATAKLDSRRIHETGTSTMNLYNPFTAIQ